MPNTIVVDLFCGDSAKGRIVDQMMETHDICVRYSGGANVGATVCVNNEKYIFRMLPVGILRNKPCYIGSQVYINPEVLQKEIDKYKNLGIDVDNLLHISANAVIVTQEHVEQDVKNEKNKSESVGTTGNGIGPCASGKFARKATFISDLPQFNRYLCDISFDLNKLDKEEKSIIFEGSQGILLDIDHGYYPFISTTNNVAPAACVSCGFPIKRIDKIVGVTKIVLTRVGQGPFVTEIPENDPLSDQLVEAGQERGSVTGRRRRVGWFDLVALEHGARVNGITEIAITKADIVEKMFFDKGLPFKVCHSYSTKGPMESEILIDKVPTIKKNIKDCIPVYDLYYNINEIIEDIEGVTGVKVTYVSRSKNRD